MTCHKVDKETIFVLTTVLKSTHCSLLAESILCAGTIKEIQNFAFICKKVIAAISRQNTRQICHNLKLSAIATLNERCFGSCYRTKVKYE